MAPVIRHLYQQMPEPKWVISMGACATSTGVFNNYALIPVNQVIPVDVYVPGCPPRPEQLIYALMMLQEKIQNQSGTCKQVLNLPLNRLPTQRRSLLSWGVNRNLFASVGLFTATGCTAIETASGETRKEHAFRTGWGGRDVVRA